jgi:hypothetical protein
MQSLKKMVLLWVAAVVLVGFGATCARAELVAGWNWADSVTDYSDNIQNFGWTLMDASTTWWLTGPPDADSTHDYVAGWRSNAPDESIIMQWDAGIPDLSGDDLLIRLYAGAGALASVSASADGDTFVLLGTIGGGTGAGNFFDVTFDFAELLSHDVHYVKVARGTNGSGTGMFFDAFGGVPVPEPGATTLLAIGAATLFVLRRKFLCSQDT